ncbi:MAG: DEAD/DEAH box helicase [Planctomycetales bacterium]|nr:DEAD/DEAH box helicase [Planctomycetales bacterium]
MSACQPDNANVISTLIDDPLPRVASTGWNAALQRAPTIGTVAIDIASEAAKVFSVSLNTKPIKTKAFAFPNGCAVSFVGQRKEQPEKRKPIKATIDSKNGDPDAAENKTPARILPPKDTIKLEDRLYYLLQPPLESILSAPELELPFEPFPYQLSGIGFLYPRHAAILADEMGLGKTMQAITTIRLLLHSGDISNVLLICPKPLVSNWQREFSLWAPEIPVSIIAGNQARREWLWKMKDAPVKIANYELVLRDQQVVLDDDVHFDLVALDEAQRIKNKSSSSSEVVRGISRTRSWALTGTPIENSVDDLVGIFDFLSDGYLRCGMTPRRMREATRDYILRRTKDKVLTDMPPKMFRDASLSLSAEQYSSYTMAEKEGVVELAEMGESLTIQHVFELVLRLKQICNFDPVTQQSSKVDRLVADLEEVAASGKKAIIFSQWVKSLSILKKRLAQFNPIEYHGQIPSKKRETVIDRFRNDPDCSVILMSYGAGSVGLNLQFCEYVFLFDRWWNPAIEDQAINRAHRIGAAGPVTVTRFVSVGTIEERIDEILSEKRELFATVLDGAEGPTNLGLSQDEIYGLFNLRTPVRNAA